MKKYHKNTNFDKKNLEKMLKNTNSDQKFGKSAKNTNFGQKILKTRNLMKKFEKKIKHEP